MKSYLKTLIFFPLILQIIVTALLIWFDDDSSGIIVPFSSYALTAFLLATIPAFLTALLAVKFRYTRYNIASIVFVSSIISFVYCNMASYFYLLLLGEQETSFLGLVNRRGIIPRVNKHMRNGILCSICDAVGCCQKQENNFMLTLNEHLLNQVLLIAYQAGKHLQQFYQKQVHVELKEDNTPVTEADLFVSQFLTEKLTALFPNVPVLSEENCHISFEERKNWKEYWLIDPLDGTQQFINRTDQFSVLITLVRKNKPVLSVISCPNFIDNLLCNA